MRKLDWTTLTTSGNTRDLTSRLEAIEDQLADAITDGDAWEGVDEGHPFANVISAKSGLLDLIRDIEAGEVTVAERKQARPTVCAEGIDAALADIDKLNAITWMLSGIEHFGGLPSKSVLNGIYEMLSDCTGELETFVREVWNNTRTDSNALK